MTAAKKIASVLSTAALGLGLVFTEAVTVMAQDGGSKAQYGGIKPTPGSPDPSKMTDEGKALLMID